MDRTWMVAKANVMLVTHSLNWISRTLPTLLAGARNWPENMESLSRPKLTAVCTENAPDAARKCAVAPPTVWSTGKPW